KFQNHYSPFGEAKSRKEPSYDASFLDTVSSDSRSVNLKEVKIMAIYHFSAQVISRGRGQSAVASASYRSGDRLLDERTGEEKYYRRDVQPDAMIFAPTDSPEWVYDRERLWNEVESAEKRKDSQLAREINVALPKELPYESQKELIANYVQKEFVKKGMIADIAIHHDDPSNPHAHVMLTTRTITAEGFGPKNRDWNQKELLTEWREQWAEYANQSLEKAQRSERISHRSHEDHGLEVLPTVHLGHVAHAMEKRGALSNRGNINRERQEYNVHVVDLQKYREEKKTLEQAQARQRKQRQTFDEFMTAAERVDVQKAVTLLKSGSQLPNLQKRSEQLDQWEKRVNNSDQYLRWEKEKIREASDHFKWIHSFEQKIQDSQQHLETLNWLNPLKLKENRQIKERAEQDISRAQNEIKLHNEKLHYHREKLKFHTEYEFIEVKHNHEEKRPGMVEANQKARQQIRYERDILQKASIAYTNSFIRNVASAYPERPEMAYMSYETAQKLASLIEKKGNVISIETIQQTLDKKQTEIKRLQREITHIEQSQSRLQRAGRYLKDYEKHQAIVDKYENNPFLKGKLLLSKTASREYNDALTARNQYERWLTKDEVSGREDYKKQVFQIEQMEAKVPEFKAQIQTQERGLGFLGALMSGIEQAGREMQRQRDRQQQKTKRKGKAKKGPQQWSPEI
ncbi:MobQ family relaxase, partial [Rossellomorea arthrocnemi]|uniref:MobQ family relaxase n=1 Tax=Rossellomorea arthrocnemi TaxID=2769542 RepID=UPI001E2F205E